MAEHTSHKIGEIKHPGLLTERAKAAGMTVAQYEAAPHKSAVIKKEVQFAENAKKWHHGGRK